MSFIDKLFGGKNALETYRSQLEAVNAFKDEVAGLTQEQMKEEISNFKLQISKLEGKKEIKAGLEEVLPRVFALTREAG